MTDTPPPPCCDEFARAQQDGTDNEGWGALIQWWEAMWTTGCELPPLRFYPWCGAKKESGK